MEKFEYGMIVGGVLLVGIGCLPHGSPIFGFICGFIGGFVAMTSIAHRLADRFL
jgi:hypothetical protein